MQEQEPTREICRMSIAPLSSTRIAVLFLRNSTKRNEITAPQLVHAFIQGYTIIIV